MFTVDPIGYFRSASVAPYDVPRQAGLWQGNHGVIELKPDSHFEYALEGLDGFDRIWVLYRFHRNERWKPKVLPPRGGKKQGVFATRSPHRPNFIGLSCVELLSVEGLKLTIINHDLIDGTPILDLKPYLCYADAHACQRQGWLDSLDSEPSFRVAWSPLAQKQLDYLENHWHCSLQGVIEHRLQQSPLPYPNNRVRLLTENRYELAYRTWRVYYRTEEGDLIIDSIGSGYDAETLNGRKESKWDDVPMHQAFIEYFA